MRRVAYLSLIVLALALPGVAAAETRPAVATVSSTSAHAAAPVATPPADLRIGGRTIATFRASLLGYTPMARATGARLKLLNAYRANPHMKVTTRASPDGTLVLADGDPMFLIAKADVDEFAGETTDARAADAVAVILRLMEERAQRDDPVAIGTGVGISLAATIFALLLLRLAFALNRRFAAYVEAQVSQQVRKVQAQGVSLLEEGSFLRVARALLSAIVWSVAAIILVVWLNVVLESLPWTRAWGHQLTEVLLRTLETAFEAALDSLPGLLVIVAIIFVARAATRTSRSFFDRVIEGDLRFGRIDRDTAAPTHTLIVVLVWILALTMIYPYLPFAESRAFQGLSVLVGLMVSIGAAGTIGQAVSGLILMYTRAYRIGEYVRIQGTEGTVTELGLYMTRVRTGLGEEVMIPNSVVLSNSAKNYSRSLPGTGFVLDTSVTIGYDTPWRQVNAMLIEAARRTPGLAEEVQPRVFQTGLQDFYVEYRLVAYSHERQPLPRAQVLDRLHGNIQDVFNEHGVQIMSPHYRGDPAQEKIVPVEKWYAPPARRDDA